MLQSVLVMNLCRRMEEAVFRLEHGTLAERIAVGFDLQCLRTGNFCLHLFSQPKTTEFHIAIHVEWIDATGTRGGAGGEEPTPCGVVQSSRTGEKYRVPPYL